MATSQNGYSANDRSVIMTYTVTKAGRTMALRKGPPGEMLADFVRWFDENIRDIDPGVMDEWGYAERKIIGSLFTVSNHASGTAADVDATKWPLGSSASKYLTAAEIARIRTKLLEYEGCIRWGADYTGRKDPMHFEINKDAATVARVWAKILAARSGQPTPSPSPDVWSTTDGVRWKWGAVNNTTKLGSRVIGLGSQGYDVKLVQQRLAKGYPSYAHQWGAMTADGRFGPVTFRWVKEFQRRSGLTVDGLVGPATLRKLG